jgi:hypothetical protein
MTRIPDPTNVFMVVIFVRLPQALRGWLADAGGLVMGDAPKGKLTGNGQNGNFRPQTFILLVCC